MAGSTFQPPIHLDPTQDPAQQTAFINQNLQAMASALETNSFRIVKTGTLTWTLTNTSNTVAAGTQTNSITHSLGYLPVALVYFSSPESNGSSGTILTPMPFTDFFTSGANKGLLFSDTRFFIDTTKLTFQVINLLGTDYSPNVPTWTIQYYLLQQTAN